MKRCFKCEKVKELDQFYRHPNMKDGHVNKCKECNKADVRANRKKRVEYYREYDRERGNRQPPEYVSRYRSRFPNKYKAHSLVNYAIKTGKLFKEDCSVCGASDNIHAHHDDYSKPLNVRWLCSACHRQWHVEHGEAKNP